MDERHTATEHSQVSPKATTDPADGPQADEPSGDAVLEAEAIEGKVIDVLKTIYDPEIPIDIYELGLIYRIDVSEEGRVDIDMTLTSPACPVAGSLPPEVEFKVSTIPEVTDVNVRVVWSPPWTPDRMSEAAKLELNMWW